MIVSVKQKRTLDKRRTLLMSLMLMDFIFTYIGINVLNYITEGNPLMVKLFELPFLVSLAFRLLHIWFVYVCLEYIQSQKHPSYNKITTFALIINVILVFLHLRWIASFIIHAV